MIVIQSYTKIDSLVIFFTKEGIEEMINYLNFIKTKDESIHLNIGNELNEIPIDNEMFVVPHIKLINVDSLKKGS